MFLVLKISWYNHRVFTEYEGIERKLLLETSEANINNLVNAVPEGIIVIDENQNILMKNEAFVIFLKDKQLIELKPIKKYNSGTSLSENLSDSVKSFRISLKKTAKFGVIYEKNAYLECTGSKII